MDNKKNLEMRAQFPVGETLKQLDPDYGHPNCSRFFSFFTQVNQEIKM